MPNKPNAIAKKKAVKKPVPPVKLSKATVKKFVSEGKKMEYQELVVENEALKAQVSELEAKVDELEAEVDEYRDHDVASPPSEPTVKWVRGKLPGEKYIKTDPSTGKFEVIDKAQWDSLR